MLTRAQVLALPTLSDVQWAVAQGQANSLDISAWELVHPPMGTPSMGQLGPAQTALLPPKTITGQPNPIRESISQPLSQDWTASKQEIIRRYKAGELTQAEATMALKNLFQLEGNPDFGTAAVNYLAAAGNPLIAVPTGANIPAPTGTTQADVNEYLNQPSYFQALYEKAMGLPTAGRSSYQNWLADQWQMPASEYALRGAGLMGTSTTTPQTFQDYLLSRQGQPVSQMGGQYTQALANLSPTDQRAMLELLPDYASQAPVYASLRQKYPTFIAGGLANQGLGAESTRAWGITPEAVGGGSFLTYLAKKYNLV